MFTWNLSFLTCKLGLKIFTLQFSVWGRVCKCLSFFRRDPVLRRSTLCGVLTGRCRRRDQFLWGYLGTGLPVWKRARKTLTWAIYYPAPWHPSPPIHTMGRVSFPSTAFAYFTVLTSCLKDLVKLQTSSTAFYRQFSHLVQLGGTSDSPWFLRLEKTIWTLYYWGT